MKTLNQKINENRQSKYHTGINKENTEYEKILIC